MMTKEERVALTAELIMSWEDRKAFENVKARVVAVAIRDLREILVKGSFPDQAPTNTEVAWGVECCGLLKDLDVDVPDDVLLAVAPKTRAAFIGLALIGAGK